MTIFLSSKVSSVNVCLCEWRLTNHQRAQLHPERMLMSKRQSEDETTNETNLIFVSQSEKKGSGDVENDFCKQYEPLCFISRKGLVLLKH